MSTDLGTSIDQVAHAARGLVPGVHGRALLMAMSGIDGSGKTVLSRQLAARMEELGLRVAHIGVDPWQNPQTIRFGGPDRGVHFYRHAIRFGELFGTLVRPLVARRSIHLVTQGIRTDRDVYEERIYAFDHVDVVLVEGIFLLQRQYAGHYDLKVWVDCSFETALRRALERNVEDLPADRLREDYATVYHAAQRHHFAIDDPRSAADCVIANECDLH